MPWADDDELRRELAGCLGMDPGDLISPWDVIIPNAGQSAAADISTRLLGRGYTALQIDGWDSLKAYHLDLGVYWCGVRGATLLRFDLEAVKMRDRRKELESVTLMIGGLLVFPAMTTTDGQGVAVAGGRLGTGPLGVSPWRFTMDTEF